MVYLPHIPCLWNTEPLPTYLSRLAAVNGAASLQDFRRHFALTSHKSYASEELYSRVHRMTGIPESFLESSNLFVVTGHGELGHAKLRWTNLHTNSARYCPTCVLDDLSRGQDLREASSWARGSWQALSNFVCVKHSIELFTSPIPYHAGNRWDFAKHLRDNQRELEFSEANAKRRRIHPYDTYFADRLDGRTHELRFLEPLPYHVAYRLCELVGRMKLFPKGFETKLAPARMHDARCTGFDVLSDETNLIEFLDELRDRHVARGKTSSQVLVYGTLQKYLSNLLTAPSAQPLIRLVREHAMNALPIGPDDDLLGRGGVRKWHTISTASQQYGIDTRQLRNILIELGLINASQALRKNNEVLIPACHAVAIAEAYADGVDLQYVEETFGVVEATVWQLMRVGVIKPLYGAPVDMKAKFSRTAINDTLDNVIFPLTERGDETGLVSPTEAVHFGARSVGNVILALTEGKLKIRYRTTRSDRRGFERILLDPHEVREEFTKPGGIKRHEFRAMFHFRTLEGDGFFYSSLFERARERCLTKHHLFDVVTRESLEQFHRDHVSLAEVSSGRGRPVDIKKKLHNANVLPVWEIKGRRALTFYRRREAENLLQNRP